MFGLVEVELQTVLKTPSITLAVSQPAVASQTELAVGLERLTNPAPLACA